MKKLLLILLCLPFLSIAQDDKKPALYEVDNMEVKTGMEDAFEAAVKSHNEKFHPKEGDYHARLFYNINGPFGGQYSWIMGPTSFTALDDRPGKGAHDEDWKKVTAMVDNFHSPTYWSEDSKLSHIVPGTENEKRLIWVYDLKMGQSDKFKELIGKVKEVYDKKRPTESMGVYWNEFLDTKAGMDVAIVFPFAKWAWLDKEGTFKKQYEELNGAGSMEKFLTDFRTTINGRTDWLREQVK